MKEFVSLDGTEIPDTFPLRSLFYGEGVFETFRWKGDYPALWKEHLERMKRGAQLLDIPFPGATYIAERLKSAVSEAGVNDARIKICLLSQGRSTFYESPKGSSILIGVQEYVRAKEAFRVCVSSFSRNSSSLTLSIKSLSYLDNILARREANSSGFDEALFLNERGQVTECSAANIFFMKEGVLYTPSVDCGLLAGVVRGAVMALAPELGYRVVEGQFDLSDLFSSKLVFVTNSGIGAVPVSQIDEFTPPSESQAFLHLQSALLEKLRWTG